MFDYKLLDSLPLLSLCSDIKNVGSDRKIVSALYTYKTQNIFNSSNALVSFALCP